jgi:hypothetical protein
MRFNTRFFAVIAIALSLCVSSSEAQKRTKKPPARPTKTQPRPATNPTQAIPTPPTAVVVDERQLYMNAARIAWAFVDRNYQPATGLVRAHDTYQYVTVWDIASTLAATYSAHELGLVSDPVYNQRMQRALTTLSTMGLFDGAAFNKMYDSRTARMIDRREQISSKGYGWSITDIGRLLTWLRIIAVNQPQFAPQATAIVQRLNMSRLITADGYLQGEDTDPRTGRVRSYPEGRMGYEQYAAAGLALWGKRAEKALDARVNAVPANVLGVSIITDRRGNDRITSVHNDGHGNRLVFTGAARAGVAGVGGAGSEVQEHGHDHDGQRGCPSRSAILLLLLQPVPRGSAVRGRRPFHARCCRRAAVDQRQGCVRLARAVADAVYDGGAPGGAVVSNSGEGLGGRRLRRQSPTNRKRESEWFGADTRGGSIQSARPPLPRANALTRLNQSELRWARPSA